MDDLDWKNLQELLEASYAKRVDAFWKSPLPKEAKCECGASKTGIQAYKAGHSSWCPVVEKKP